MHRYARGADRMALGLEPTRRIDRQAPAHLGEAILDRARAAPRRYQAHGLVFDQLRDSEAVMRLDEREIAERDAGGGKRALPGERAALALEDVAPRQRPQLLHMG